MSRFFRATRPFLRSVGNLTTPLCVTLGVASTVPTPSDAPSYVQDVFKNFKHRYPENESTPSTKQSSEPTEPTESTQSTQSTQSTKPIESKPPTMIPQQSIMDATSPQQTIIIEEAPPKKKRSKFSSTKYLSRFIDHTVLKPMSNETSIRKMCKEAMEHNFFSVCCNPCWVSLCKDLLKDSNVKICCVVGFPLGSNTTNIKVLEAQQAVKDGADEIDMVMSIGFAKSGYWDKVESDIAMVVDSVPEDVSVKVILETCLLTDDEVINGCRAAVRAGAKFVKTSTGFAHDGATVRHVQLMRKTVDEESVKLGMRIGDVLVKASGGIRDSEKAKEMLRAGADRIGASSGIKIIGANIVEDNETSKSTQNQY